jgi:hypothetical protein
VPARPAQQLGKFLQRGSNPASFVEVGLPRLGCQSHISAGRVLNLLDIDGCAAELVGGRTADRALKPYFVVIMTPSFNLPSRIIGRLLEKRDYLRFA